MSKVKSFAQNAELDNLPFGILVLNSKNEILFSNKGMGSIFGYSKEELKDKITLKELFKSTVAAEIKIIHEKAPRQKIYLEAEMVKRNGTELLIGITAFPYGEDGYMIVFQDLIELADLRKEGMVEWIEYARESLVLVFYSITPKGPEPIHMVNVERIFGKPLEMTIRYGIYLMTATGQGNARMTGLFGPFPVPDSDYLSLGYATEISDREQTDARAEGKRYTLLALIFPRLVESLFLDRRRLRTLLRDLYYPVEDISDINLALLEKIRTSLFSEDKGGSKKHSSLAKHDLELKMRATFNLSHELIKATDLRSSLEILADFCERILDFKAFSIFRINHVSDKLELVISRGLSELSVSSYMSIPLGTKHSVVARVAQTGKSLNIGNIKKIDFYLQFVEEGGMRSEICIPIKFGNEVLGVMNVESETLNAFSDDDESLLTLAAEQASWILRTSSLAENLKAIHQLAQRLQHAPSANIDLSFDFIKSFADKLFGFRIFSVLIMENPGELRFLCHSGFHPETLAELPRIPFDSEKFFVAYALREKKPVYVPDLTKRGKIPYSEVYPEVSAEYAIPLVDAEDQTPLGVVNVESTRPLSDNELLLLEVLAHHANSLLMTQKQTKLPKKVDFPVSSRKKRKI